MSKSNFQEFEPYEYMLIDLANNYGAGLDKKSWDARIEWAKESLPSLEYLRNYAENPALFYKASAALRRVAKGYPVKHTMGLDATSSGSQILSCMSGCISGMIASNVLPAGVNHRSNLYDVIYQRMLLALPTLQVTMPEVKKSVMTFLYNSKKQPEDTFGVDSVELETFYNVMQQTLPGALALMEHFNGHWNPKGTMHNWVTPDGFKVEIPVTQPVEHRIECAEAKSTYYYEREEVTPTNYGVALPA